MKKIVARFLFNVIIEDHPLILWDKYKDVSGINETEFFNYFNKREKGLAIEISHIRFFKEPIDPKNIYPNFKAPQSFCYIEDIEANSTIIKYL